MSISLLIFSILRTKGIARQNKIGSEGDVVLKNLFCRDIVPIEIYEQSIMTIMKERLRIQNVMFFYDFLKTNRTAQKLYTVNDKIII